MDGHLALTTIYKYLQTSFKLAAPATRYIGWITRNANLIYNSSLKFSGYIYGQANGNAAKARMGFWSGKTNGCGWIATYNALKILGKSVHPKNIIYFYECWGSILQGTFGILPDAVADYFRSQGKKVSMLNLTNSGIDKKSNLQKFCVMPIVQGYTILQLDGQEKNLKHLMFTTTVPHPKNINQWNNS